MLFGGKYDFLSNFYPCKIYMEGYCFENAEAAYQSMKCPEEAGQFVGLTGIQAKKKGWEVKLREDWEDFKLEAMEQVLRIKFGDPDLFERLENVTGEIVKDNTWRDTYWGRCNGKGENHLGKILMKIRDEKY